MATQYELWLAATAGTPWSSVNVKRELDNVEGLALRPRIPDDHLIYRVFRAFPDPRRQIKVVLLGQDPYPEVLGIPTGEEDQEIPVSRACGFSFSSPLGNLPLSLRIIISEILREYPQPTVERGGRRAPRAAVASDYSGDLSYLISEGVFLLNTYLTVSFDGTRGIPLSHTSWIAFSTQILKFIRRTCPNAVYLALGKKAADLMKASGINDAIECDHPANRFGGRNPFNGSDLFITANALLEKRGVSKVDWIPMKKAVDTKYYVIPPSTMTLPIPVAPPIITDQDEELLVAQPSELTDDDEGLEEVSD